MNKIFYNRAYYKKNCKRLIQREKFRRQQRRAARINNGERLRQVYKTDKKNRHGHSLCGHGIEQSRCKKCKGGSICEHNKRRSSCWFCSPVGWAKRVLRDLRHNAVEMGYVEPMISPEQLVVLKNETIDCVLCEQPLLKEVPRLHHNHRTGAVAGFTHNRCNTIEGLIEKLEPRVRRVLIRNVLR